MPKITLTKEEKIVEMQSQFQKIFQILDGYNLPHVKLPKQLDDDIIKVCDICHANQGVLNQIVTA